ncbi:hypothetical protein QBC38DRAFT_53316 [Podospora fimiseda]|uniref:C2H2-type domain-containing protein n=1 Tax=Podospora fimiseda TaxID=252190 RepID=A0AAN7GNS3_9PEZI|nr:hypothetical protein QBC38DRAFT_53316 [Podospora fimiseda]
METPNSTAAEADTPSSAMDAVAENKPLARVGFQHPPLPFRGAKESIVEPQQERAEGEWAKSFADRRSYTGWSIATASTFTNYTETDLDSPGFGPDDGFNNSDSDIAVQIRKQSFCLPSRVSSFASVDRFLSSPDSKGPTPNIPWKSRPSDIVPQPRRSRLAGLNIPQPGSGLARDLTHPSPIAEDARSGLDSDEEEEGMNDKEEKKESARGPTDVKGKDVEVIPRSETLPVDPFRQENTSPRSEKSDDQFHSSSGADTPDSTSEADAVSSHRPDPALVQDISDKVLKYMFGLELSDLPQGQASAAFESVSYCLEELSNIITPGKSQKVEPSINQAGRESAYHPNVPIQPAGGDGGSGHGTSPAGDSRKGRARKRPENERDEDEEDDEDEDEEHRHAGGKRQKTEPRFGCPFRKRNPIKFNVRDFTSCATQAFPDMPQLKRHIKNIHGRKALAQLQCPRCRDHFPSDEALSAHSTRPLDQMCSVKAEQLDIDPEEGITREIEDLLNGRKANSKVDRWDSLWRVLFPNDGAEAIPPPDYVPPTELDEVHQEMKMSYSTLGQGISQHFDELKQHMQQDRGQAIRYMLELFSRHTDTVFDNSRAKTADKGYKGTRRNHNSLKPGLPRSRRGSTTRIHKVQSIETMASSNDHSGFPSSMGTPESGNHFQRPPHLQTNTPSPGYHGPMSASPGGFHGGFNTNALSPDTLTTPVNPLTGMPGQFPGTVGVTHLGSPMQPQNSNHRRIPTGDSGVSFGQGAFNMSPNAGGVGPNAASGALPVRNQALGVNYQANSAGASPINEMRFFGGGPQQQIQMTHPQHQQLTAQKLKQLQDAEQQRLVHQHQQQQLHRLHQQRLQHQQHQQAQQLMAPHAPFEFSEEQFQEWISGPLPEDFSLGDGGLLFPQPEVEVRIQPPSNQASTLDSDHSPHVVNKDGFLGR